MLLILFREFSYVRDSSEDVRCQNADRKPCCIFFTGFGMQRCEVVKMEKALIGKLGFGAYDLEFVIVEGRWEVGRFAIAHLSHCKL